MTDVRPARSPVAIRIDDLEAFLAEQGFDVRRLPEPLGELLRRFANRLDHTSGRRESATHVFVRDDETLVPAGAGGAPVHHDVGEQPVERLGLLGQGGMAEVWRARDPTLDRVLAVKILHEKFWDNAVMHARFLAEARLTAQLAHPAIPPVHAIGVEHGLPWFAMKEVHGRTLLEVMDDAPLPRKLDVFQKVCEGVAYAHSNHVVHCDLKPSNIMVGAFGEVLVMDWGVARVLGARDADGRPVWSGPGSTGIAGTPLYMPPEQALGEADRLGPASDVYALGVILYRMLTGHAPFPGLGRALINNQLSGEITPFDADEELAAIVRRALRPDPADRFPDASALGGAIARWREGVVQRERALAVVTEADALFPAAAADRARAAALRARAAAALAALDPDARVEDKEPAWALEDEASALDLRAALATVETVQKLHGALAHAPDLREAHAKLAAIHHERHADAEARRAWDEAAQHEILLRDHDRGEWAAWLSGESALTLVTEPPVRVRAARYELRGRRWTTGEARDLGTTPLRDVPLPVGSWLLELSPPDGPPVRYPVGLGRDQPWTCEEPVHVPRAIRDGTCAVLAGWASLGGDPAAPGSGAARRVWIPGFLLDRDPVTVDRLFAFLAADGATHARSVLRSGVHVSRPDWPACGAPHALALAFAAAHGARLPEEDEWEKAARGADGRFYPWGDTFDPAFARVRAGDRTPHAPRGIAVYAHDRSPYGVRGLGGNVRDWCAGDGDRIAVRGGSYRLPPDTARSAARARVGGATGHPDVGFRLAWGLP